MEGDKVMTEKERIRLDCTVCSGLQTDIGNLKKSDEKQWDMVELLQTSKASSSQMKWIIGILIGIVISAMGVLWKTQASNTTTIVTKIEAMDAQGAVKRDEINIKLDTLKDRVNELKWSMDEHLKKTNHDKK
jgi:hypothetical protein